MKQEHGEGSTSWMRKKKADGRTLELADRGKALRRRALNRAEDDESKEEIEKFIHGDESDYIR